MREAGLSGRVFHELIGFDVQDAPRLVQDAWDRVDAVLQTEVTADADPDGPILSACVVAHAPYSVSPELFSEIALRHRGGPLSIHLAESAPEIELIRRGTGPMRELLEDVGVWRPSWVAPGCDPVEYLSRLGYLMPGLLAAHGTHLTRAAMERLRDTGATIVTCPRSNVWVGGGLPPLARYYASGVDVAIGTDSLASSPSLNLFDELAECRRLAPEVTAASFLESATLVGARSLGLEADFGTLTAGKRADLVSVDVPPTVADVEEYLVGGVSPGAIRAFAP